MAFDAGLDFDSGDPHLDAGADAPMVDAAHLRPTNEPPTARGETFYTAPGVSVELTALTANDVDPDGDALTLTVTMAPTHGTLVRNANDNYTYTPATDFVGEDWFEYSVSDDHGAADATDVHVYTARHTYYVSPSGNDSNAGTAPTAAWRTVDKVVGGFCSDVFVGGDVILLERGATFSETLSVCGRRGDPGLPIVVGAYGVGAQPAITGSTTVSGWTRHSGDIWKATVSESTKGLYFNGLRQNPARSPNVGWFKNAAGSSSASSTLVTPDLTGPTNAYVGATVRIRTRNWSYETAHVTSSSSGQLSLDVALSDVSTGDWGYFVDNQLQFLDAPGEWYYDEASHTLYFEAPHSADPNTGVAEAVVRESALEVFTADGTDASLVFDDIAIKYASTHAVIIANNNRNVVLRRVTVSDSQQGIAVVADDVDVVESEITRTLGTGIVFGLNRDRLLRSRVTDIAVEPGYGESVWGYMGIRAYGDGAVVQHCVIDNIGYIGLVLDGANSLAEENFVSHALAVLNDGGGISFDHCDGLAIRRNVVVDAIGSYLDTVSETAGPYVSPYDNLTLGIAFGNTSIKNTVVEGNVVAHNRGGIAADHTTNSLGNVVRDNLIFDNVHFQLAVTDQGRAECTPVFDDIYTGNTLVPGSRADILFSNKTFAVQRLSIGERSTTTCTRRSTATIFFTDSISPTLS
ncbi:MAG: cadherin-like domain-containing protein [Sandaracinaceae bacterium]|nr:cadherin-like domain-containing protein [Sandaracinaceae bacterium]